MLSKIKISMKTEIIFEKINVSKQSPITVMMVTIDAGGKQLTTGTVSSCQASKLEHRFPAVFINDGKGRVHDDDDDDDIEGKAEAQEIGNLQRSQQPSSMLTRAIGPVI